MMNSFAKTRLPRSLSAEGGYNLVEMLMVVAIIGIIGSVGPRMMIQLQNFYLQTTARNDIQRDARTTIDLVNRFMRQAKYRSIIIDSPSGQGPYSRITFQHIDGRNMKFYQSGKNLVHEMDGATNIVTKNLIYLAFTFPRSDYPRLVSVSMTMGKDTYKGQQKQLELTIQKIRVMN